MPNKTLKFDKAAAQWEEAFPLGNGQIGAMVYGGIDYETIQFNHDTLWSGTRIDGSENNGRYDFDKIRKNLFEGEIGDAEKETCRVISGRDSEAYIPAGYLFIRNQEIGGKISDYRRELRLDDSIATTHYKRLSHYDESVPVYCPTYDRTSFVSYPHNVFVMKIKSNKDSIRFTMGFECDFDANVLAEGNTIHLNAKMPANMKRNDSPAPYMEYDNDKTSISYQMAARVILDGGYCTAVNDTIRVEDAREVVILVSIDTSFISFDKDPVKEVNCDLYLDRAEKAGYDTIFEEHIRDYKSLFDRVELDLGDAAFEDVMTNERIDSIRNGGEDTGMTEMLFNYGRYLMIAGSREGTQPTNLFGIWNGTFRQRWQSGYTTNINTQMNYWPAEVCNLSECHEPLLRMVEELSRSGERTALEMFGCRGFCSCHNVDLWRITTPAAYSHPSCFWPMAGGWFVRHLWEHYLYNTDKDYLRNEVYPITKKAAEFFVDWLITDSDGYYVTAPSISPENTYYDEGGNERAVSIATTMDMSIIKEVFAHIIEMSDILGINDDFTDEVKKIYPKLYPFNIASDGTLLEWYKEYKDVDEGHRHVSHLYGLFPAELITDSDTELYNACEKSIRKRLSHGGGHTGWSGSWILCLFARLKKGGDCQDTIEKMQKNLLYDNLMDCHPPFQIDGNYGITAGIAEMLLQSHKNVIEILPAASPEWKTGSFKGLKARGGYDVSVKWENGEISYIEVTRNGETVYRNNDKVPFGFKLKINTDQTLSE